MDLKKLIFVNFDPLLEPFEKSFEAQIAAFWTPEVVNSTLTRDEEDWRKMDPRLKHTASTLLHYLLCADYFAEAVAGSTADDYSDDHMPIKACFGIHSFMEIIHAKTYAKFLEPLYGNNQEMWLDKAIKTTLKSQASMDLLDWGRAYAESSKSNPLKFFIGMICYEGIMFQPFFAIPYAFKKFSLLQAFCMGNELIARDENMHMKNYVMLYHYYTNAAGPKKLERLEDKYVKSVFANAVDLSCKLITEAVPQDMPEFYLIREQLFDYTKLTANGILKLLNYEPMYTIKYPNGLSFMTSKDMPQYTSFHTSRPTEYKLAGNDGRSLADLMASMM